MLTPLLLLGLVGWSTAITLVGRYSRGVLHEQYTVSSTILVTECVKLLVSLAMMLRAEGCYRVLPRVLHVMRRSGPMSVPALAYLVQNTMGYLAMEYIPASTHMMLLQLKLLTTAVFAVLILRKKVFPHQWRALLLLFVGIVLVQWPTTTSPAIVSVDPLDPNPLLTPDQSSYYAMASYSGRDMLAALLVFGTANIGLLAALTQSVLSGFAGVYTEWQLKGRIGFTLWEQNAQLSLYSIVIGLLSLLTTGRHDLTSMVERGFFADYSVWTLCCIVLNSCGGLLVAAVLLYGDTILKNFASTVAILSASLFSALLFHDTPFTINFTAGTIVLLAAMFSYNEDVEALADSIRAYRQSKAEEKDKALSAPVHLSETDKGHSHSWVEPLLHKEADRHSKDKQLSSRAEIWIAAVETDVEGKQRQLRSLLFDEQTAGWRASWRDMSSQLRMVVIND